MKNTIVRWSLAVLALLALGAPEVHGQSDPYEQGAPPAETDPNDRENQAFAQPRQLVALQDDLQLLDEGLSALSRRDPRQRGQRDGWLRLDFDTLTPEDGPSMDLRSHVVSVSQTRSGDHALRNSGLGALLGGVLGGIIDGKKGALIGAVVGAGGGLLASQGDDVDLPEGTLITLRLDGPMTLARR